MLIFTWISSCVSFKEKSEFYKKPLKTLSKHVWRCPKKLEQQPLQKVRNHGNYVKNDFYIGNRESSLAKVENENNETTGEKILIDYEKRIQTENNNNNANYVRCHYEKLS